MVFLWILLILILVTAILWCLSIYARRKQPEQSPLYETHYAHRGLHAPSHGIPENSLRAFRFAADAGYGAELDVHLSRDGRLVIMHDENVERMTGVDREIYKMTSEEIDKLRLDGTPEPVPYLEDVLKIFRGRTPLLIEIKTHGDNAARLTSKVCKLLKEYPDVQFCMESFDPRVLIWLRKNRPDILRGQLSAKLIASRDETHLSLPAAIMLTNLFSNFLAWPDFIAYRLEDRDQLSFRLCRLLWKPQEFNWTVTSQEDADACLRDDRVIIFQDFPPQK